MNRRVQKTLLAVILPIIIFILWWTSTKDGKIPVGILPPISLVKKGFQEMVESKELWQDLSISLGRLLKGFLFSTILGIVLGSLIGMFQTVKDMAMPLITVMSAAIYAKRANLSVEIVEKDAYATGQIADSNRVDNYIGMVGMNGYDLGEKFRQDVENLGVAFVEAEMISIKKENAIFHVTLSDGTVKEAKTVIYAAGDVRTKKLRQVSTAVADGANAATEAISWIKSQFV